jgi:hypothetical protein
MIDATGMQRARFVASTMLIATSFVLACSVDQIAFVDRGADGGGSDAAGRRDGESPSGGDASTQQSDTGSGLLDASSDGMAGTFCQTAGNPFLCNDFESGPLPGPWQGVGSGGGGTVTIEQDPIRGTRVMRSALGPETNGERSASLRAQIGSGRTFLSIEADVLIEKVGTSDFDMFQLESSDTEQIGLELSDTRVLQYDFEANGTETTSNTGKTIGEGWVRIRLEASQNGGEIEATAFVDGVALTKRTTTSKAMNGNPLLELGEGLTVEARNWAVRFDNVVVIVR